MSEKINEQISALLDGELPEAELGLLLKRITQQPELLQQAQCVQQTRLCLQGEKPSASISSSFRFTARIQDAIRAEPEFSTYDQTTPHSVAAQLNALPQTALSAGLVAMHEQNAQAAFSARDIDMSQTAANESGKWRPLFGAGIAAAVALVAVSAWQSQSSLEPQRSGMDAPLKAQTQFEQAAKPSAVSASTTPALTSKPAAFDASVSEPVTDSKGSSTDSYTVPEISGLNVDTPLALQGDFRQAKYSSYLLQNQVAPQSTSDHLSQYAQQLRTRQAQQIFIDPRTGMVMMSIVPKENR